MISENKEISLGRKISDVVDEYNNKVKDAENALNAFEQASNDLKKSATVSGTWGDVRLDTGRVSIHDLKDSLKKSAWLYLYKSLSFDRIFTAKDKNLFNQSMTNPPEFNMDNIRASFGEYIKDPKKSILRGLAEVFCSLDQSYKSHDKVKIGVRGLPKRVIISGFGEFCYYGEERIKDIINALAAYRGEPLISYGELQRLISIAKKSGVVYIIDDIGTDINPKMLIRGMWLKIYKNGNGHLYFNPKTLKDINRALSEFYGDALGDDHQEKPQRRNQSTEIAKDLQYYPTPLNVVDSVLNQIYIREGDRVLEPSCGCGRFIGPLIEKGADVFGVEVDIGRVGECRNKGYNVYHGNFLEMEPNPIYDYVVMNPPFYGKHYLKHVEHAMKFLKENGTLVSILPITARYDHGELEGEWWDLPVGSFSESGTNINTTIYKKRKR